MSKKKTSKPTAPGQADQPAGFDVANFTAGVIDAREQPNEPIVDAVEESPDDPVGADAQQDVAAQPEAEPIDEAADAADAVTEVIVETTGEPPLTLVVELDVAELDPEFYAPRQVNATLTARQRKVFGLLWRSMMDRDAKCEVYQGRPSELVGGYSSRVIRCLLDRLADQYERTTATPSEQPQGIMAKKTATTKKKTAAKAPPALAIADTCELSPDDNNPRKIGEKAERGLRNSIERFGDLSGIVFNRRTGDLVCGHQRTKQLRALYGDRPIEVLDAAAELGCIRVSASQVFPVRVVDWSTARQRAANVAANSQKIAGEYTDDLSTYLLEVADDLQLEDPGLMDAVLLTELASELADLGEDEEGGGNQGVDFSFEVIVACRDEKHQREVHDKLHAEGLTVKCLTL